MLRVVWFRKDLRLIDNRSIAKMLNDFEDGDEFFFLYIKNKNNFKYFGVKRVRFLLECLVELKNELSKFNFNLHIHEGDSISFFNKLKANTTSNITVYAGRQPEPYCIKRDAGISEIPNIRLCLTDDSTIMKLGKVVKDDKSPYTVYTPFKNKFYSLLNNEDYSETKYDLAKLRNEKEFQLKSNFSPEKEVKKISSNVLLNGGREVALESLKSFYETSLSNYKSQRDFPSIVGTSKLSAHLHFGTLSIREAFRTGMTKLKNSKSEKEQNEISTWLNELIWREFYYNITYHFPQVEMNSFKSIYDKINWSYDKKLLKHWSEGKTGYPIVDAGMRQLNQTGWMHNRLRMIVAMFLTKDLFIDWRWGEKYFAENLIDMDFSSNNGGWQWSASTGCDAQPYFRIFNPVLQSKKFDSDGNFIRKFIPELKSLPDKFIHEPWVMSDEDQKTYNVILGKDYPKPIVEHAVAKEIAIKEFKSINKI